MEDAVLVFINVFSSNLNSKPVKCGLPISKWHRPFFGDIVECQIEQFDYGLKHLAKIEQTTQEHLKREAKRYNQIDCAYL
jgi:hypothetical protein